MRNSICKDVWTLMVAVGVLLLFNCASAPKHSDGIIITPQIVCKAQSVTHSVSCTANSHEYINIAWVVLDGQNKIVYEDYGPEVNLIIPDRGVSVIEATFCVKDKGCPISLTLKAIRVRGVISLFQ